MSQGREPDNEDYQEFLSRLEREFKPRGAPLEEQRSHYRMSSEEPSTQPADQPPSENQRRVALRLPLSRPRIVFALLAANVLMYAVSLLLSNSLRLPYVDDSTGAVVRDGFTAALYVLGAKENNAINVGQWWRLLTPMVLHGSLTHLLFNSWALYVLGTQAEQVYGMARFAAVYVLAGLAGSIASYAFNPESLSVGASGAIFGLLGALAAYSYTSRSLIGWEASKMQLGQMATLALINLAFGFIPGSNIDNSAHIGGLVVGGIVGFALAPRYAIRRSYVPQLEQRGSPVVGWAVAVVTLVALIGLFVIAYLAQVS